MDKYNDYLKGLYVQLNGMKEMWLEKRNVWNNEYLEDHARLIAKTVHEIRSMERRMGKG